MKILVRAHLSCYKFFIIYDQTWWIYNRRRKENNIRMISRKEGLYCEKAQKKHKLFSLTELRMDANIMLTQRTFISASYAQCLHTTMPAESFCLGKSWSHIAHEGISHISVVCFVCSVLSKCTYWTRLHCRECCTLCCLILWATSQSCSVDSFH